MESLRDKMYNYEVNPSPNCWEKISAELDSGEMGKEFPAALYNMEVTPPAATWEKVKAAINPEPGAIVRPIFRRQTPFLRYAVAAVLVGLIGFAILRLAISGNNDSENSNTVAVNKDSIKSSNTISGTSREGDTSANDITNELSSSQQSVSPLAATPSIEKTGKKTVQRTVSNKSRAPQYAEEDLTQSLYAYEDHVPDIAERYVMLMTPDGNFIRMAKKWSELLCCVSGEEQDPECKDQLKKWQQKIATSTLASSPSNFMDILGLVNSLQENNGL
jgi:hypothetical protein